MSAAGQTARAAAAEFIGAALLTAIVVGSGIMAERLAGGNDAVALLGNTLATVAGLAVLIVIFGDLSGAHFNPLVTLVAQLRGVPRWRLAVLYIPMQLLGCCAGALLANVMFDLPALETSTRLRTGPGQWLGECVASAGLILVAFTSPSVRDAAWRVPAWIAAAYWFTSSTSFANPAITVGRSLSDTFAGIRPLDVPGFILAQLAGGLLGLLLLSMFQPMRPRG